MLTCAVIAATRRGHDKIYRSCLCRRPSQPLISSERPIPDDRIDEVVRQRATVD